MLRRDFLRKTTIALAGGLIVGDAALELFERLTHRAIFTGANFNKWPHELIDITTSSSVHNLSGSCWQEWQWIEDCPVVGKRVRIAV